MVYGIEIGMPVKTQTLSSVFTEGTSPIKSKFNIGCIGSILHIQIHVFLLMSYQNQLIVYEF